MNRGDREWFYATLYFYAYSGSGKGWGYSADELHVIGLPEGEDGYTLPGWYDDPKMRQDAKNGNKILT
ncbi:hypothetical protein [Butyrivibrio sp. AE2015]|uniref:hypothetical protein n=1 Tax=Butyrivibrio sp. AE2015 TaxID=1280663 RepID=UPI0003B2E5D1|nr:hypothetical protein [Butyrivibrio sp. AE2015]